MTVLPLKKQEQDLEQQEEFLTPEEEQAGAPPAEEVAAGEVDPRFRDQDSEHVVVMDDVDGFKHQIVNDQYVPIAKALWKQFKELADCNPFVILFVEVQETKRMIYGKPCFVDIMPMSTKLRELFTQVTNKRFDYMVTIYPANIEKYEQTHNQMLVHIYNALRRIKADGKLRGYDIQAFGEVYANLKAGWDKENCLIPNLLDTGNWLGMHQQQQNLFETDEK